MRAQLINERLKRGGDPLETMDVGVSIDDVIEEINNACDRHTFFAYRTNQHFSDAGVYSVEGQIDSENVGRSHGRIKMYVVIEEDYVRRYEKKSPSKSKKIPLVPGIYDFVRMDNMRWIVKSLTRMTNLDMWFGHKKPLNIGEFKNDLFNLAMESIKIAERQQTIQVKEVAKELKEEEDRLKEIRNSKKKLQGI